MRIGGGIRLLDIQLETAVARLTEIGAVYEQRGDNGKRWWIATEQLEAACTPEGKVNPESVLEWRPAERVRYRQPTHRYKNRDEFFHEFAKAGWISDRYKAELIFVSFCKFMLHWLVNEQKPVELGFCTLVPVPLRANWKSLLLTKGVGKKPEEVGKEVLNGLYTAWRDKPRPRLGTHSNKHIFWSLEVLPERSWFRATIAFERVRRSVKYRLKGELFRYCRAVTESIRRSIPSLARLYATYVSQVKRPAARLGLEHGLKNKVPQPVGERRGDIFRVAPARVVHPAYDLRNSAPIPPVELGDSDPPTGGLSALPDLPSGVAHLRPSRSDMDEPPDAA